MKTENPQENYLGLMLGVSYHTLHSFMSKKLACHQLPVTAEQGKLIMFISRNEGINQQEIATILMKEKPAITRLLDVLEEKNFVLRVPDKTDRRNKLVYLTNAGKVFSEELKPLVMEAMNEAKSVFTEEEFLELKRLLHKLKDGLMSKL